MFAVSMNSNSVMPYSVFVISQDNTITGFSVSVSYRDFTFLSIAVWSLYVRGSENILFSLFPVDTSRHITVALVVVIVLVTIGLRATFSFDPPF